MLKKTHKKEMGCNLIFIPIFMIIFQSKLILILLHSYFLNYPPSYQYNVQLLALKKIFFCLLLMSKKNKLLSLL
jgi:hypothetical protein